MRRPLGPRSRPMPEGFAILVGAGILGAAAGIAAYVGLSLLGHPGAAWTALVVPDTPVRQLFALTGAAFGLLLGADAAGMMRLRTALRHVTGAALGSIAGLLLYALGYVATNYGAPASRYVLFYYLEAIYSFTAAEAIAVVLGAAIGFLMARYTWRFYGVLTYVALSTTVIGYLVYAFTVTLPRVPRETLPLSILLIAAEAASLFMFTVYAFYALDIFVKKRWRRSPDKVPFSRYYLPKVAFHVPVVNEPVDMVVATLRSILAVDYPKDRFVVMVLDDSSNEDLRGPLEEFCREHGVRFVHRDDRTGYKAGALNHGLRHTPEDVDLIAVIDADYQIEPDYLKETAGYFINPNLGFLQTPQDYRNRHQSFLTEQYYFADAYFYRAILPSRNEENTIIFAGTMGIVRRTALERVGGWGEKFICEDAELSVRVLQHGYDSMYVNRTYGRGLIPATFEAYKRQHYRWSFGGVKILLGHFWKFLFSRLTLRQKFDFMIGGLHWFDGIYILTIGAILLALGVADTVGYEVATYHKREIWLIGLVPLFLLVDGIVRLHLALRRSMRLTLRETLGVMGMWFAIKFNDMFAAVASAFGGKLAFLRTPKAPERRLRRLEAVRRAVRVTKFESTAAGLLFAVAGASVWRSLAIREEFGGVPVTRVLLTLWLAYYGVIFLCAPLYAYKSYVTFTPDEGHELGIGPTTPSPRPEHRGTPRRRAGTFDAMPPDR